MQMDYGYLASSISTLAGLPVRLYQDGIFQERYHRVAFEPDLAAMAESRVFQNKESVSYYMDENFLYYGLFRVKSADVSLLIGPVSQMPVDMRMADRILRSMGENVNRRKELVNFFSSIPLYPLRTFLQILCVVHYFINGERLGAGELILEKEALTAQLPNQSKQNPVVHNSAELEERMLSCVEHGKVAEIQELFRDPKPGRAGIMAGDVLRQEKNLLVCTATLVTRAAIRGGLAPETAFVLSDLYIQKAELMTDLLGLERLNAQMVLDFTKRVEAEKCGVHHSRMVRRVRDYVFAHISEQITTDALAKECGMNRTYLCKLFADETGMTVGKYVTHIKMEEAKRLMDITRKSIAEIAEYLGYSSQSHFQRVFKQHTGLTPGVYRSARRSQ